jgi:hypothetical protein
MMIFASSIGRSGTRYLGELFSYASDIKGHHIPEPQCAGNVLSDYNNYIKNPILNDKKEAIRASIRNDQYFESSQLFIRCFVDEVLELREELSVPVGVIHIVRDPLTCARSYTNRKSGPDEPRCRWRPSMSIKKNFLKIDEDDLSLFQKNLWDWFECEIRYHSYKDRFDRAYDHLFSNHNNYDKLKDMFRYFDVNIDEEKLREAVSKKTLPRGENKQASIVSERDMEEAEAFISRLNGRGLEEIFSAACYSEFEILRMIK